MASARFDSTNMAADFLFDSAKFQRNNVSVKLLLLLHAEKVEFQCRNFTLDLIAVTLSHLLFRHHLCTQLLPSTIISAL